MLVICIFFQLNKTNSGRSDDKKANKGTSKNESTSEGGKTAVVFSLKNEVGGLVKALRLFQVKIILLFIFIIIYWLKNVHHVCIKDNVHVMSIKSQDIRFTYHTNPMISE